MKNFYVLDFEGEFIRPNSSLEPKYGTVWDTVKVKPTDYISEEGLKYLSKIGIIPFSIINLFVGSPNSSTSIHIDNLQRNHCYAINYAWGSENSDMIWFHADDKKWIISKTTANTSYVTFKEEQVTELERTKLYKKLVLVRVDIPHVVHNYTNDYRYCLSIRSFPRYTWENIVEYLKPYIVS